MITTQRRAPVARGPAPGSPGAPPDHGAGEGVAARSPSMVQTSTPSCRSTVHSRPVMPAPRRRARPPARGWRARPAGSCRAAGAPPASGPARRRHQLGEVDAGLEPHAVEHVDEVLGGEVARGAGRVGAAAQPAHRGVEGGDAQLEPDQHVGERRAAGVVHVQRDGARPGRARGRRPTISRVWLGVPTPMVSPSETCQQPSASSRSAISATRRGSTLPSYGQPQAVET